MGRWDDARRAIAAATGWLTSGVEAQFNGPLAAIRMDFGIWQGELAAARAAADESLPILTQTEDVATLALFYARALRVEAEAAERGRAGRDEEAVAHAITRAGGLLTGMRGIDVAGIPAGFRALVELWRAFGEAEASRVGGTPRPDLWERAAVAGEARPMVHDAAYARYHQAEALLADRAGREAAAGLLARAREVALGLGAAPLLETIDGLAARARLVLDVPTGSEGVVPQPVPEGVAAYDLTPRETEVLRLLATGRTNRQIGEALFISESTAGVHVSRILAKFGVAGRVEAATIAARLGLAE